MADMILAERPLSYQDFILSKSHSGGDFGFKPITTFNNSGKCGACRYQEQLMRKRHGGAYSRA